MKTIPSTGTRDESIAPSAITELDMEALETVTGGGLSLGNGVKQVGSAYFVSDENGEGEAVYF